MELLLFIALIVIGVVVANHRSEITKLSRELESLKLRFDLEAPQQPKDKSSQPESSPRFAEMGFTKEPSTSQLETQLEPSSTPPIIYSKVGPDDRHIRKGSNWVAIGQHLQQHGLLWCGAFVLAMGGIFLAKYSIEAGIFPPQLRIVLGSMFGVALVLCAEYLARHRQRFNIQSPYVNAALASGGVITCFAMVFVSFDIYSYLSPQWAFLLLGLIAFASTYLALRFGPILAYIGVIGSYTVPGLVPSDDPNIMALLLYTGFVSTAAVWVSETVRQRLLWWMSLGGHMSWFVVALIVTDTDDFLSVALFSLASVYIFVLVNLLGWNLQLKTSSPFPTKTLLKPRKEHLGILLPLIMLTFFLEENGNDQQIWISAIAAGIFLCMLPLRHSALDSWPFIALLFTLICFGLLPETQDFTNNLFPYSGRFLLIQIAAMAFLLYSTWMIWRNIKRRGYLLLIVLEPLLLYGVSYAVSPTQASLYLYPLWSIQLTIIAVGAAIVLLRSQTAEVKVTCALLFNACLSLVLTMLLEASSFTLAIVLQIASMSYLARKYEVTLPDWLFKAALAVVLIRLTLAPWLSDYAEETILSLRWTIVIYPMVLSVIVFAMRHCASEKLRGWYGGSLLHVLALLVTTETGYVLTGGYPNLFNTGYQEGVLLAMNWLILSSVYLWRSQLRGFSQKAGLVWSGLLAIGAVIIHLNISFVSSPFIHALPIGKHWLINWLALQWLVPALLLLAIVRFQLLNEKLEKPAWLASAVFLFFYINGIIRNTFHDGNILLTLTTTDAELYTYSAVWLLIATLMVFVGYCRQSNELARVGFIMLFVVVLKAFIVDMNNLQGLYRALSFIGLGLCLVMIGWLFQRIRRASDHGTTKAEAVTDL